MSELTYEQHLHLTLLGHTAALLKPAVENNAALDALGRISTAIYGALRDAAGPVAEPEPEHPKATKAQIKASITDDYLVSFEDGRRYKMLKRHLHGVGLTPDEYRTKWGLPADYPMTSKAYSERRSTLAKDSGLGRK